MDKRRQFGNYGENEAKIHLIKNGYKIIQAPWQKLPYGEIDIIAKQGKTLVFIEVKTRSSGKFGFPEESVTSVKRFKISRLIDLYLAEKHLFDIPYRFDVIAVETKGEGSKITHIKSVGVEI